MNVACRQCNRSFSIPVQDQHFYSNLQLPLPTHCPDCRTQRRMATRNERNFYPDQCELCKKSVISLYSADKSITVYCHDCWWGETWTGLDYGKDIDWTRPFFDQFQELQRKVPRANVLKAGGNIINSDYCSYIGDAKNCYLVAGSIYVEDCYYGNPYYSKQCVDSLLIRNCELSYECITSENLYNCAWCQDCFDSRDLLLCYDLKNCSDCIGCVGLRNKQYCIFNVQYTKDEYVKEKMRIQLGDPEKMQRAITHFTNLKLKTPRRYMFGVHNEAVTGNYINSSVNSQYCFDVKNCENVQYSAQVIDLKDCYDNNYTEENELCVDYIGSWKNNRCFYSNTVYNSSEVYYSELCYSSKNLFGCVGLKNAQHCILNKQYTKEDYFKLREQLIEHMKQGVPALRSSGEAKEWGEFFPVRNAIFAYNESVANDYFPLSEEQVVTNGWQWQVAHEPTSKKQTYRVPRDSKDVKDDICQAILNCKQCQKNYKIIPQELVFYKQQGLPIPKHCVNCRQLVRMKQRPVRALWQRQCMCTQVDHSHGMRCLEEFSTAYNPEAKELIYCDSCYQKTVY